MRCKCGGALAFDEGVPVDTCGMVCGSSTFEADPRFEPLRKEFEGDLRRAAAIVEENISHCSYAWCAAFDQTAGRAAAALNASFCREWTQRLASHGLRCGAASEIYGFGRSSAHCLIIRLIPTGSASANSANVNANVYPPPKR